MCPSLQLYQTLLCMLFFYDYFWVFSKYRTIRLIYRSLWHLIIYFIPVSHGNGESCKLSASKLSLISEAGDILIGATIPFHTGYVPSTITFTEPPIQDNCTWYISLTDEHCCKSNFLTCLSPSDDLKIFKNISDSRMFQIL